MNAFVTGGTGLLGSNLIRLLRWEGHSVKALVRSREKARRLLQDDDVVCVSGDMTKVDSFADELKGCDVLFHTAAYFRETFEPGDHRENLHNVNVKGTMHLLLQAKNHRIRKVVFTGTCSAFTGIHAESKARTEEAIARYRRHSGIDVTTVLAGWMFGPYDAGPTPSGRLIRDMVRGRTLPSVSGSAWVADARDVALAMIAAAERGASGERYEIAGEYHSFAGVLERLESVTGSRSSRAMRLLFARSALANAMRQYRSEQLLKVPLGPEDLGITTRPLDETLLDSVDWFRRAGNRSLQVA